MGDKSLLVHRDLGRSNENLLSFAGELADRFDARVIGITACAPSTRDAISAERWLA